MIEVNEAYVAQFFVAAEVIASTKNNVAKFNYESALRDSALNAVQTGKPPVVVVAPFKVAPDPDSFPDLKLLNTDVLVSSKTIADFMPKQPSPEGEVGDGIGGKIPKTARSFYDRTNVTHESGESKTVNGRRFIYDRPTPFGGYWVEV